MRSDIPRRRRIDWEGIGVGALVFIGVLLFVLAAIAYTAFQWGECRKDPDHTFWHCVAVVSD